MTKKLFVGGLAWATDNDRLAAAFSEFGTVEEARVIMDRETGQSKGFGFVTMDTPEAGREAMAAMNETMVDGRSIRVSEANDNGRGGGGRERNSGGFHPRGATRVDEPRSRETKEPEVFVRRSGMRASRDDGTSGSDMPKKRPLKR